MDRKAFYHLYVNLNSLVELGLRRRAAQLLASLPDSPPPPQMTEEEAEAQMMKSFENLDMSALDQVWENLRHTPLELEQIEKEATAGPLSRTHEPSADADVDVDAEPAIPKGADLDAYMQRAYTYEAELRERIDRLFAKADLGTMSRQLSELGGPQSPLTGQLTGPQMAEWLERDDDPVLTDLATGMRRLDMEV